MLYDIILLQLFVYFIFFVGVGLRFFIKNIVSYKESNDDLWLILLYGIFTIGLISLVVNFFTGVSDSITYTLISIFFLLGLFHANQYGSKQYLLLSFITLLVTPLTFKMSVGYDGGLYHIPYQLWLREEKIVFGLANLHARFGFSSLQEYVQAPLWLNNKFLFVSYSSSIYIISFILLLWNWVIHKNPLKVILGFLILINIIFFHSYFIWAYSYNDNAAGIVFVMAVLYGIILLIPEDKNIENTKYNLFIFCFLSILAVMLKLSSSVLLFIFIYVLIISIVKYKLSIAEIIKLNIINGLVWIIWSIKNVIISGCLLYPFNESCLRVSWSAKQGAVNMSNWITAWARHPRSDLYSLETFDWFKNWWFPEYKAFIFNLIIVSCLLIILVFFINYFSCRKPFYFNKPILPVFIFLFFTLVFWFVKAPTPRFGIGIFILFPVIAAFLFSNFGELKISMDKRFIYLIFIFICFVFIRVFDYKLNDFSKAKLITFYDRSVPEPEVNANEKFGVKPIKGNQCWMVPHCAPNKTPKLDTIHGYGIFYSK